MESSRQSALRARHADLEGKIQQEETRPMPDDTRLHELKKQKLAIRDDLLAAGAV